MLISSLPNYWTLEPAKFKPMSRNVIPPMIAVVALSPAMIIDLFTTVIRRFNSDQVFNQMVDMGVDTKHHRLQHPRHIVKRDMIMVGKVSAMNIMLKRLSISGSRMSIIIEIISGIRSIILICVIKQVRQMLIHLRWILAAQLR